MKKEISMDRRNFLKSTAVGIFAATHGSVLAATPSQIYLPTAPVGIARCRRYNFDQVKTVLSQLFDSIGNVESLVKGKTITVKVNLTGYMAGGVYSLSQDETVYTHPIVTLAASSLFQDFGAKKIVICESHATNDDTNTAFQVSGYDVATFKSMIPILEFENTRNLGTGTKYNTLPSPDGPYIYSSFDLNYRYYDTDVMVSIAKMKNHDIAGITLSMKNLFGMAPNAIYADPGNENATSYRMLFHDGNESPSADGEITPVPSHDPGFRVPRIVVDLNKARPIDLAIIDAIVTQAGGEGDWNGQQVSLCVPGLLLAGLNPVCTDAVGASVMGYNPEAEDWTKPFYNAANTLRLAAERGLGTNKLSEIDVVGMSIQEARYTFLPGKDKR